MNIKDKLAVCINASMYNSCVIRNCELTFLEMRPEMGFYYNRLRALHNYSLVQAHKLVKMICWCAFNDSSLTDNEAIAIMETCLDPALDNILLEVNFNAGW